MGIILVALLVVAAAGLFAGILRRDRERRDPARPMLIGRKQGKGVESNRVYLLDLPIPGGGGSDFGRRGEGNYGTVLIESDGWHMHCSKCGGRLPTVAPLREEAFGRLIAHWDEVHGMNLKLRKRPMLDR